MTYLAILEHENGVIKRYLPFSTQLEAEEYVSEVTDQYPDSFSIEHPGDLRWYKLDLATKTFSFDAGSLELNKQIRQAVHDEANRRVNSLVPPEAALPTLMEAVLITRREVKGRAKQEEIDRGDVLENIAVSIKQIRKVEKDFITNDLPNLTQDQLLNFDPKTDVIWP